MMLDLLPWIAFAGTRSDEAVEARIGSLRTGSIGLPHELVWQAGRGPRWPQPVRARGPAPPGASDDVKHNPLRVRFRPQVHAQRPASGVSEARGIPPGDSTPGPSIGGRPAGSNQPRSLSITTSHNANQGLFRGIPVSMSLYFWPRFPSPAASAYIITLAQ